MWDQLQIQKFHNFVKYLSIKETDYYYNIMLVLLENFLRAPV